jgi:hypothetical protein
MSLDDSDGALARLHDAIDASSPDMRSGAGIVATAGQIRQTVRTTSVLSSGRRPLPKFHDEPDNLLCSALRARAGEGLAQPGPLRPTAPGRRDAGCGHHHPP